MITKDEKKRYARHLKIPEIGENGQERLKESSVLIVGIGGLGSASACYLAAAGVGRLGIIDGDKIDLSNLQRQILYSSSEVDSLKIPIAFQKLHLLNPNIEIIPFREKFTKENAARITKEFSYVVDGSDNFETRYLINDVCVRTGKIYIYGAVYQFFGQISVFDAVKGPCFQCLFPQFPPDEVIQANTGVGVVSPIPGVIGTLQALEVIKMIVGAGNALIGRLLLINSLNMNFKEIIIKKNSRCPICSE